MLVTHPAHHLPPVICWVVPLTGVPLHRLAWVVTTLSTQPHRVSSASIRRNGWQDTASSLASSSPGVRYCHAMRSPRDAVASLVLSTMHQHQHLRRMFSCRAYHTSGIYCPAGIDAVLALCGCSGPKEATLPPARPCCPDQSIRPNLAFPLHNSCLPQYRASTVYKSI
jgi:hypothetical protein